ncbi:acyl-CoA dehydrogenase family protein [Campylobacter gastrosuis]|uniref:Acyl-CoA/acyl-ACP dehydrogenase n=1 Tax=Campylobacter gastrosuis TaxID=2974576 RepID=A0ABT7HND8_9BACT|nr:acyl-CoA dehydrogenase family protein [Campylobacter gastrosuis]MDL0088424.1 acyl-CoA/acyl-ACP dehydrogenase [Campylobacter gastrosuis]
MALQKLEKLAAKIDTQGLYAKDIITDLAKQGFFKVLNDKNDISKAIENIAKVSYMCGTTGFCVWCQFALIWYVLNSDNEPLKAEILAKLQSGEILGGTALSNPMKAFVDIEKNHLKATKTNGGYLINGTLPWVSNIQSGHYFGAIALSDEHPIMALIRCDERVKLSEHIKYATLDGSATKSVNLRDYFVPDSDILATDIYDYLCKITPGFILLQTGIAAGIISSALDEINRSNQSHGHINKYLPYSYESLKSEYESALGQILDIAKNIQNANPKDVLEIRLNGSLLTQKITSAAVLFSGTKGYFKDAKVQRLQREGNFVLIVTPSIKHLNKEIEAVKNGNGCISRWRRLAVSNA